MPPRRRMTGYGSDPIPKPTGQGFPLPPPPDGKPPVRLPFGGRPTPEQAPMEDFGGQSDDQLMQLMQMLGLRNGTP